MDCYLGDNGNVLALVYDPLELLGSRSKLICQSYYNYDYMIAELLLSPISATPSDTPSLSPIVDDTPQSDYLLTY